MHNCFYFPGWDGCQPHLQGPEGQPGQREAHGGVREARQWCKNLMSRLIPDLFEFHVACVHSIYLTILSDFHFLFHELFYGNGPGNCDTRVCERKKEGIVKAAIESCKRRGSSDLDSSGIFSGKWARKAQKILVVRSPLNCHAVREWRISSFVPSLKDFFIFLSS